MFICLLICTVTFCELIFERYHRQSKYNSTSKHHSRKQQVQWLSVSKQFWHWLNDDRKVTTNIVHQEQKYSQNGGFQMTWWHIHYGHKYNTKPGLSWKQIIKLVLWIWLKVYSLYIIDEIIDLEIQRCHFLRMTTDQVMFPLLEMLSHQKCFVWFYL